MWLPPWRTVALGYNPRQYGKELAPAAHTMRYWQTQARPEVRESLKKLPKPVLETLFRRLRRWSYYRDLGGERYYLLYRGVRPDELVAAGGVTSGSTVNFAKRTSYTADPSVAAQFAMRYGTRAIGEWVPENAIVSAPFALGPQFLRDYSHGELEIIVDPHTGVFQDENLSQYGGAFCGMTPGPNCLFEWAGAEDHPWQIESARRQAEMDRRREAGKDVSEMVWQTVNPTVYRKRPPTPDSKTSRGF